MDHSSGAAHAMEKETMMREVDESCEHHLRDDQLIADVPGYRITHRLNTGDEWLLAMAGALALIPELGVPEGPEQDRLLNRYLDQINIALSGLERRIIFTYVTGRNEA
jgi:hypothetical protein